METGASGEGTIRSFVSGLAELESFQLVFLSGQHSQEARWVDHPDSLVFTKRQEMSITGHHVRGSSFLCAAKDSIIGGILDNCPDRELPWRYVTLTMKAGDEREEL